MAGLIDRARHRAVIFDMDGVITDTASVHEAAWKQLFDGYLAERASPGPNANAFSDQDYRRFVDGRARIDGVESFLASRGIRLPRGHPDDDVFDETAWALANRKNRLFLQRLDAEGVRVFPSTIGVLDSLRDAGVRTAVVSASKNRAQVLRAAGVEARFDASVDGVDAERLGLPGKPDPALFLEAARRLGVKPAEAVVVEDALAGVEAGRRGGFALVVGVDRSDQRDALIEHGADVVVRDLRELVDAN
jgi:beta-phosphoglucomutase family hydrolase